MPRRAVWIIAVSCACSCSVTSRTAPVGAGPTPPPPAGPAVTRPSSTAPAAVVAVNAVPRLPVPPEPAVATPSLGDVVRVAQLTGPGSANATDIRWNVFGADLGHMFW